MSGIKDVRRIGSKQVFGVRFNARFIFQQNVGKTTQNVPFLSDDQTRRRLYVRRVYLFVCMFTNVHQMGTNFQNIFFCLKEYTSVVTQSSANSVLMTGFQGNRGQTSYFTGTCDVCAF